MEAPPFELDAVPPAAQYGERVLIVDGALDPLAELHDTLEEAGYTVLMAQDGATALRVATETAPNLILLGAAMTDLDGFEVLRRLKADPRTTAVPVIFMTDPTEAGHVEAAFEAGGVDHLNKPVRPREVLACLAVHLRGARAQSQAQAQAQARNALDAFGHASLAVHEKDGRCVWQTTLTRALMAEFFAGGHFERGRLPPEVLLWLHREALRRRAGAEPVTLTVLPQAPDPQARWGRKRLSFALHRVDPDALGEGQWLIVMRKFDDAALMDALVHRFKLSASEGELLYWMVRGKSNADIGDALSCSPRAVQEQLEQVFSKLGVTTRTAAVALATGQVPGLDAAGA